MAQHKWEATGEKAHGIGLGGFISRCPRCETERTREAGTLQVMHYRVNGTGAWVKPSFGYVPKCQKKKDTP